MNLDKDIILDIYEFLSWNLLKIKYINFLNICILI